MKWERFAHARFNALFTLALCLVLMQFIVGGASSSLATALQPSAPDTVHLHGQIRDTLGNPRQGYVVISTFLGPDITQGLSDANGYYAFDVPPQDHYVVTVFPSQRVSLGAVEVPVGFVDRWERINRATETDLTLDLTVMPGGTILLDAYDPQGNPLFIDTFPHQAFFISYPLGQPACDRAAAIREPPAFAPVGMGDDHGNLEKPGGADAALAGRNPHHRLGIVDRPRGRHYHAGYG